MRNWKLSEEDFYGILGIAVICTVSVVAMAVIIKVLCYLVGGCCG